MPPGASLWLLPAGSGTFMSPFYSRGLNRVHNVRPCSPGLWPGKLDLSNTPVSRKTLSFSKPPQRRKQLRCFLSVLDGTPCPGLRCRGTLQGSVSKVPRGPAPFRQKRPYYRPWRPGSYPTRAGVNRLFPVLSAQSFGLGGPGGPVRLPMTPLGPRGPRGSATRKHGYYSDYPVQGKVAGKPNDYGSGQGPGGSSRTLLDAPCSSGQFRAKPLLLAP